MDKPDWIVESIVLSQCEPWYRLWVRGRNLSDEGRSFFWHVRDVANPRFDLSQAVIEPAALPYLGRSPREVAS